MAFSPDSQMVASASSDKTVELWEVATGKEQATLSGHTDEVLSVAFSPDGQTVASGSDDHTVKLWERAPVGRPDLIFYFAEGWCKFDPETEDLRWNESPRNLHRSLGSPFRNVPRWSSLGILQRPDLSSEEKNFLFYLRALEAENWAAAAIFRERLTPEQKTIPNASVLWAIRTLAGQAVGACEAGLPVLARMRAQSALGILAGLNAVQTDKFHARLGEAMAESATDRTTAEPVLAALRDEAARTVVAGTVIATIPKFLNDAKDFDAVVSRIANARTWGAADPAMVFARADGYALREVTQLALESAHVEANAFALAASEAWLKVDPDLWIALYLRGRALGKAGQSAAAILLFEKALEMAKDKSKKEMITKALGEARAAVKKETPPAAERTLAKP